VLGGGCECIGAGVTFVALKLFCLFVIVLFVLFCFSVTTDASYGSTLRHGILEQNGKDGRRGDVLVWTVYNNVAPELFPSLASKAGVV
jgi:hypothetical protein